MSDRISTEPQPDPGVDQFFERLRWLPPPAPFAPAAAVRRRARQRTRRQASVAGAAAAVVVLAGGGLGVGALGTVRTADPVGVDIAAEASQRPPTPEPTSRPTEVPQAWLLSAADLGPQWRPTTHELLAGDPPWFWGGYCTEPLSGGYPSLFTRVDLAVASWEETSTSQPRRVDHVLELFASEAAAMSNLRDIKQVVELCPLQNSPRDQAAPTRLEVLESGFAGDESLLIEERSYFYEGEELAEDPHKRPIAVVRVGATVSTVVYHGEQDVREVARLVADLVE